MGPKGRGGRRGGRGRGRGGRGGRGGRHGGRGRGRMGRGMLPNEQPHYLNALNQYNAMRVLSYLAPDDRDKLGVAYPRFRLPKRKPQPQKQTKQEPQTFQNDPSETEICTAISSDPIQELEQLKLVEPTEGELQEGPKQTEDADAKVAAAEKSNDSNETTDTSTPPINAEQPAKKDAAKSTKPGPGVSDPHTLLARLNSKRLYRRIRHYRKGDPNFDPKKAYRHNMTTEQIAIQEWQDLLAEFKQHQIKKLEEKKDEGKSHDEEEEVEEEQTPSPLPSSCEMLLFSPCPRAVAVLASYPRSGNSLLRNLYERTTLRVTGSDMRGGLTKHDLVGEAAVQTNCVQFVKTHFPERRGTPPFNVNRAVLLVRNPYDAMESYFNLMTTNTHTSSLTEEQRAKSAKAFGEMARKEILVWRDFHEYWLRQNIPLLVIRYEDLIRYTDKVIAKVIRFVLEINDMRFFEKRIDRCIREEQIERLGSYKPRSGGIGKSLSKYAPEVLQEINTGILSTMEKFGYSEMMVPNPSEWELEPMDDYGVYLPGTAKNPMTINKTALVRGADRHTNWRDVQRQMNGGGNMEAKCTCYKCLRAARK